MLKDVRKPDSVLIIISLKKTKWSTFLAFKLDALDFDSERAACWRVIRRLQRGGLPTPSPLRAMEHLQPCGFRRFTPPSLYELWWIRHCCSNWRSRAPSYKGHPALCCLDFPNHVTLRLHNLITHLPRHVYFTINICSNQI